MIIMINNYLKPHIHNILTHPGGAIAIDLFFKHDFKFRIISIYLSSTNQHIQNQSQETIILWTQQALSLNLHPIILGNFNTSPLLNNASTAKTKLLSYLHSNCMYDLADHTNNTQHTWQHNNLSSRIDYIWAHDTIILYLIDFSFQSPLSTTHSDHLILISKWIFPFALSSKLRHKTCYKRRIF